MYMFLMIMMTMMVHGRPGESKIVAFSGIYIESDDLTLREADESRKVFYNCWIGDEQN